MYSQNLIVNNIMAVACNTEEIMNRIIAQIKVCKATDYVAENDLTRIIWSAEREYFKDCLRKHVRYTASGYEDRKEAVRCLEEYIRNRITDF